MKAISQFHWAQGKMEEVTGLTREQREQQACARRLAQMAKKREKDAQRQARKQAAMQQAAAIPNGDG